MEQSPSWQTNRSSASYEIPCILWHQKAHHHIHKCPFPALVLSQINPFHAPSHFLKIHFNITFSYMHGLPSGLFLPGLPTKMLYEPFLSPICATSPAHLILLDLWPEYLVRSTDHEDPCVHLSTPIISSLLGPNILSTTMCLVQSTALL